MRTLAIGDIHGCLQALLVLLDVVQPQPDEQLILLGDYVDRGPDTRGVLDCLVSLRAGQRVVALRGNHEQMMVDARRRRADNRLWLSCGGRDTLASYALNGSGGRLSDVPERHWHFLERELVDWCETDAHFFVHANALPHLPLPEQPAEVLLWEPLVTARPHLSGKTMVCGHTQQMTGLPLHLGHAICIDTWAFGRGWLTCLDVASGHFWQANQQGERRAGWLEPPRM